MTIALRLHTELRSFARRVGLIRALTKARSLWPRNDSAYEERLRVAMENAIRPGDVVWDVGANVGLYTAMFAAYTGDKGVVCAFEPAPACFRALTDRTSVLPHVRRFNFALGADDGSLPFHVSADPLAATHTFASNVPSNGSVVDVRIARADSLVRDNVPPPNVMKIDVEGFEKEVLQGANDVLSRRDLRAVFIEVHFGLLEARGARQAPSDIVATLRAKGFDTRWVDSSHLVAERT